MQADIDQYSPTVERNCELFPVIWFMSGDQTNSSELPEKKRESKREKALMSFRKWHILYKSGDRGDRGDREKYEECVNVETGK